MDRYDVIIIGAGLDGLICAATLAKAGRSVIVLSRPGPGEFGTAQSWQDDGGLSWPMLTSRSKGIPKKIVQDLNLADHGIRFLPPKPSALVSPDGPNLVRDPDPVLMGRRLENISSGDADDYRNYLKLVHRQRRHLDSFIALEGGAMPRSKDLLPLLARAGQDDLIEAVQFYASPVRDVLDQSFELEPLKALLLAQALGGYFGGMGLGPLSPTGAIGLLCDPVSLFGYESAATYGEVVGGPDALVAALKGVLEAAGTAMVSDTQVSKIAHEKGAVKGVTLEDGQSIEGTTIVGDVDIKRLCFQLIDWKELPEDLVLDMAGFRNRAQTAQINFVLSDMPQFAGLPAGFAGRSAAIHLTGTMLEVEQAYDSWKRSELPKVPPLSFEMGAKKYRATAYVHYIPARPNNNTWTEETRLQLLGSVIGRLIEVAPGFDTLLLDAKLVTPEDYETNFGLVGGQLTGGNTALDQTLFNRPAPQMAAGRLPLKGLHLTGLNAASAPFLSGQDGYNVARKILAVSSRKAPMFGKKAAS